ncbi:MAG: DUF421 domain-containing protein [Ruminococcaceae bacterium]|nr:DUF421 domain-containing protein [Oscillospiraceae bacterium]
MHTARQNMHNNSGDIMTVTLIRSVIIYFFVIAAVRIMGKRQVGELKPQELVITILISAVATIPLQEHSIPLSTSLIPILIFISLEIIESALSMKSLRFRNIIQGRPVYVIKNGVLQQKALERLRFTVDDLLDALRQKDVFTISDVQNAVVETNGTLSVQTKADIAPLTPKTAKIKAEEKSVAIPIVMDGKPINEYFADEIMSDNKIEVIAAALGEKSEDIMLLTIDKSGKTVLIKKDKKI